MQLEDKGSRWPLWPGCLRKETGKGIWGVALPSPQTSKPDSSLHFAVLHQFHNSFHFAPPPPPPELATSSTILPSGAKSSAWWIPPPLPSQRPHSSSFLLSPASSTSFFTGSFNLFHYLNKQTKNTLLKPTSHSSFALSLRLLGRVVYTSYFHDLTFYSFLSPSLLFCSPPHKAPPHNETALTQITSDMVMKCNGNFDSWLIWPF